MVNGGGPAKSLHRRLVAFEVVCGLCLLAFLVRLAAWQLPG